MSSEAVLKNEEMKDGTPPEMERSSFTEPPASQASGSRDISAAVLGETPTVGQMALSQNLDQEQNAAESSLVARAVSMSPEDRVLSQKIKNSIAAVLYASDDSERLEAWAASQAFGDDTWSSLPNEQCLLKQIILDQFLKVLKESADLRIRLAVIDWLEDKLTDLTLGESAYRYYKSVADQLQEARLDARAGLEKLKTCDASADVLKKECSAWEDLLEQAETTLQRLWDTLAVHELSRQMEILKDEKANDNERTAAIWLLADRNTLGSRNALHFLVEQWVEWIRDGRETRLVEYIAEAIRYNRFTVLALIEHLGQGDDLPTDMQVDDPVQPPDPSLNGAARKRAAQALLVDRRISRQLADMSDPAFFADVNQKRLEEAQYILAELKKRAVPVMLRRLSCDSDDPYIRQQIVRLLGYTGGREAVDALSRQLVADEKKRKARQELLNEYYLKPSLKRSDEAAAILNDTVVQSKRTLRVLQSLNISVFLVGLSMLTLGLYVSVSGESGLNRVAGTLTALGGFVGMIALLVQDPLDRIQNAMARLVHVETAFTSFIWQLNLNGTYIQSVYVKNGLIKDDEIAETAQRIEEAMEMTMYQVSVHTKQSEPRLVTRLNLLDPAAGSARSTVTLRGQHLLGSGSQKLERGGMVLVDHRPVQVEQLTWTEHYVRFEFPDLALEDGHDLVMLSLFVDGMETNALPFHIIH